MTETTQPSPESQKGSRLRRQIEGIIWTVFVVLLIRAFIVQAYTIPSASMEDTLLPGDFVLVAKFIYGVEIPYTHVRFLDFYKPHRKEIVVFPFPLDPRKDFVKRCVAVAGDTVQIVHKQLYINGKPVEEPYVTHKDPQEYPPIFVPRDTLAMKEYTQAWIQRQYMRNPRVRDNFGPVVVPPGHIFVMGDNRDYSLDSRFWGPLPVKYVKGRPFIIYFSWNPDPPLSQFWRKIRWRRLLKIVFWA